MGNDADADARNGDAGGPDDPPDVALPRSILSHEEGRVAEGLAAGRRPAELAETREGDPAAVERAVERIREKTDRALATLAVSPFVAEAAASLPPATQRSLRAALAPDDGTAVPDQDGATDGSADGE